MSSSADSHTRRLEAAARGQVVEQYLGGHDGRNADIWHHTNEEDARLNRYDYRYKTEELDPWARRARVSTSRSPTSSPDPRRRPRADAQ